MSKNYLKALPDRNLIISLILLALMGSACAIFENGNGLESLPTPNTIEAQAPTRPAQTPSQTPQPAPATPIPTFSIGEIDDWGKGDIVFDITERSFGEKGSFGVFSLDLEKKELAIIGEGKVLQDISPDRSRLLISDSANLLITDLDGQNEVLLADDLLTSSPRGAAWIQSSGKIIYIAENGGRTNLVIVDPDSRNPQPGIKENPVTIYSTSDDLLVWGKGSCNVFGDCNQNYLVWSSFEGHEITSKSLGDKLPVNCQTSTHYLYSENDENDIYTIHIQPINEGKEIVFWLAGNDYTNCAWSPDLTKISIVTIDRGWYSGTIHVYHHLILDLANNEITKLTKHLGSSDNLIWSPDGNYLVFTGTESGADNYQTQLKLFNSDNRSLVHFDDFQELRSENYISINHLFWLP